MRRRDYSPKGQAGESDTIVSVITMQIMLCLVIVLVLAGYKSLSPAGHAMFKSEYAALSSGEGDTAVLSGAVDTVKDFLAGLLPGVFGEKEQAALPDEEDAAPAINDLPSEEFLHTFRYDYLDDELFGMGGGYPHGDGLSAPPGATFAPVFVGGYVRPPVSGVITSGFGYREHPISTARDFHTGMDIAAPEGTAILCALPGIVTDVGECEIYGNYITVSHSENFSTFYAHCYETYVTEGMILRQGERIGKVGSTGTSTGPHLHFSVVVNGHYTDPYWALKNDITVAER